MGVNNFNQFAARIEKEEICCCYPTEPRQHNYSFFYPEDNLEIEPSNCNELSSLASRDLCQHHIFAKALQITTDAVMITTSHLHGREPEIVYINAAFTKLTGYSSAEIVGQTPQILQGPNTDHRVLKRLKQALARGQVFEGEAINYRQDGSEFQNHCYVEPIFNNQGQIIYYLSIHREIIPQNPIPTQFSTKNNLDPLTGLANRSLFLQRLQQSIDRSGQHPDYLFAVLLLDLDRFKLINDSLGHQAGDQLLTTIGQRLESCIRPTDMVARLGGDQFVILLDQVRDLLKVSQVAERIQQYLNKPLNLKNQEVFISASLGVVLSSPSYDHPEDMIRDADTALHQAKAGGKACYMVFDQTMHRHALERLQLENDLRRAIDDHQLQVYYQPIIATDTGRITGFEALLRWQHPERGMIPPNYFIPIAEETGLIQVIGQWVLREACQRAKLWQLTFPQSPSLFMSVNLSIHQLTYPNLVEIIADILTETGCDPRYLKLEITESAIAQKAETVIPILEQLTALGIQLCIDDFGTGYSSLSRLYYFPITTLKVDRSFVAAITQSNGTAKIASAIINLAHSLGLEVIAEGVETEQQLAILRSWGCQLAQGYHWAKPENSQDTEALLASSPCWQ
ncbi:diguanylate cyclase domain protein [Lyngbya aestuarii BL J]|uniref:Diguanylate cyclase domain protein n=1 Tax=Lyngbya aestuarii BL J TaxID=1348334 RepID=U7QHE8_9CYAN|nr:GGDEF domain-containing phosphodiesterase [Lyngbya aestuarii]ERT07328.1 diguanylate cyclase domain protein [Lyngbya aestuarii BL J]